MEDIRPNKAELFNIRFSNNQINMLKVLFSFLPNSSQKDFAIYIKCLELQYTLQYYNPQNRYYNSPYHSPDNKNTANTIDIPLICDELMPFCDEQKRQLFLQMRNLFQTMQNMQELMELFETMKEVFPDGTGGDSGVFGGFSPEMFATMGNMNGDASMDFSQMINLFSIPNNTSASSQNQKDHSN